MQELDDNALLREYVEHNSQEAFATLVARHVNKVYSVALRHTQNPHSAEEITQAVFVILAQKANILRQHPVLSGWLYETARLTATTFIRSEIRRGQREQEAQMQTSLNETESNVWTQIAPLLDLAMADLNETDRRAIVLRFFDGKSMKETGAALGASEDATKMRVSRAVEKLQKYFLRHGVTSTAATIVGAISANSVQAAPVGLVAKISAVALSETAASTATIVTTTKTIAMTALQKIAVTAALTAAIGAFVYETHHVAKLADEMQVMAQQHDPLVAQIQKLQRERDDATNRLADLAAENSQLKSNAPAAELLKLRGQTGMLRGENEKLAQALQNAERLNHPTFSTNFFVSKDSLAFVGYDTPENTLKSAMWAKSVGNESLWRNAGTSEMSNIISANIQGNTDEERSKDMINKSQDLVGGKILSETPVAGDEVLIQMEYDWQENGQTGNTVSIFVMKQIDGAWKIYDVYAGSDQMTDLINALNSKNSTGATSADANSTNAVRVIGQ